MRITFKKGIGIAFDVLVIAVFLRLIISPDLVSVPVTKSLYLCLRVIVPTLFVYMVLAKIIISMPFTDLIAGSGRYGIEAEVLLLGLLCGFPVGANSAVYLYEKGIISKKRAEYICAFTNNASLSFMLGYIGMAVFGDIRTGIRLAAFQLFSSVLLAIVLRFTYMDKSDFTRINKSSRINRKRISLAEAVSASAMTMISVCALIVVFSVLGELALYTLRFKGFYKVLVKGFFEFATGCAMATELELYAKSAVVSIIIGFSGLCVIMQVISVIRGKLSARMYIAGRFFNAAVIGLLSLVFGTT
ncbi:MAG: hypothetical protein PHD46_06625 [Eubacteriales bacterium]|nr:hypothetical protein [Eubacteriales bacterium]MDD4422692.1 hypothetical protein [Eubacteriales bacterium]